MMNEIDPAELSIEAVDLWMNQWLLLTSGSSDDYNMMTVAWGSVGYMWEKPFAQVVVRPQRHTRGFMDRSETFTLCAFPEKYRADLNIMGTISGSDGDKLGHTDFTIKPSKIVAPPSYNEANLILECQTIYRQDMDPDGFIDQKIHDIYEAKDYHRIYFGEILAAFHEK
ncbi:MAG: flavin reductase family protein [Candidatus Marinimicrobia bacterium]|nr:flavin reductase family protein [Candidatus Neomarinimicrobiota bacterium]MBT3630420.1 flavin reductase family protein [Candidatus Neomarinimicrobiota bacterium]MBT3823739.1 flavin reductase family protein [Candidatus Neomarinimicrobiota bacterium]MBT4131912.1 flavin reductase family protein [Candidatus Neomarinimicrobiota bacterium]MBT4294638.1 flavin reductase family protein [Candidatus Neomarinimicrobiota bacterium]